jgi:hypothetical protein
LILDLFRNAFLDIDSSPPSCLLGHLRMPTYDTETGSFIPGGWRWGISRHLRVALLSAEAAGGRPFPPQQVSQTISDGQVTLALHRRNVGRIFGRELYAQLDGPAVNFM